MEKQRIPITLTKTQHEHVKKESGADSMASYIRGLIEKDIKAKARKK